MSLHYEKAMKKHTTQKTETKTIHNREIRDLTNQNTQLDLMYLFYEGNNWPNCEKTHDKFCCKQKRHQIFEKTFNKK